MVSRFFNLFHKEFSGVHQAAFLLATAGILADVLALARDRLLASTFGAGRTLDIYFAAFRVPDFLYTMSLLIAANTALIPILLKKFSDNEEEARNFMRGIFTIFFIATALMVVVAFIVMPALAGMVAPGFTDADAKEVTLLSRILLLSPLLLGLSNLVSSVIQSFRRFFVYALSPIFYNVGIILGVAVFYPTWGIAGLGWGVALGSLFHFLIQIPSLVRLGFWVYPIKSAEGGAKQFNGVNLKFYGFKQDLWSVVKLSFPRTLGLSLNQLALTAITALASTLAVGSIAVFNLAQNLQSVPLSLIGVSYSVAAFPTLARLFVRNEHDAFLSSFWAALRHIIFWSVPATVLFIVLRAHIVRVILGAGAFGWVDTRMTAAALLLFSLSILAQGLVMLLVRAFYAAGRTVFPVLINFISSVFIVAGSFVAVWFFGHFSEFRETFTSLLRVADVPGSAMLVLPAIFSLGSILNVILLGWGFHRMLNRPRIPAASGFAKSLAEICCASLMLGVVSYFSLQWLNGIFGLTTFLGVFLEGLFAGVFGMWSAVIVLWALANEEFLVIVKTLHQKFWRAGVISQEPEKII
ncbi:MAG: hypothetical protein HZC14_02000 [Candidatus Niyogibacteria bacterium]|nr:hypothetical protein [Candidatus Niyogibacteria bacterium]